ncbi:carboxypeptidase-like regulatory domain-containing protein [Neotamlana laminarinivorans]|uniref:Carboxypeptidase-like regulatory domain-containing protein n=1 Tax=Neotamlana laminarinivorans TaxID=2883124 RepID=A0A9X1HYI3_9FLAO|nr:carboxypeptidase-like regulatory domain-containing protein [Tamlana laminarinivorans]MCB4797298.1 carboxypeptidase-like regulatory domain-containing protein [Tamlana laminarinivorans]
MKQQITLSIAKPCAEKFNSFKNTSAGGFCSSCKKEVIDFRALSDKEIHQFFKNNTQNTCGYFKTHQLKTYKEKSSVKRSNLFKVASFALISAMSLHHIQAQMKNQNVEIVAQDSINNAKKEKNTEKALLKGVISDESTPLPGVNILLKGTTIGTTTNFDGEFTFPKQLKAGDILVISYIGFKSKEIIIEDQQKELALTLDESDYVLMGEVAVNETYRSKRNLWQKIKGIF